MTARRSFTRLTAEWWLVCIVSTLLVVFCVAEDATQKVDNLLYDMLMRGNHRDPDPAILLVTIDNRSLDEIGPWPWTRRDQAQLLDNLGRSRPKAIAYDVLLTEPQDVEGDQALAQAINSGTPVYLPLEFDLPGRNGASHDTVLPIAPFRQAAAGIGHVSLNFDPDGSVRRIYRTYSDQSGDWTTMVGFLAERAGRKQPAPERLATGDSKDSLVASTPLLIDYAGPQGHYPAISAASIFKGEVPEEFLKGRLILVGATASGLGDMHATPVGIDGVPMPGVEIQANLLDSLLNRRELTPASDKMALLFALAPLALVLASLRLAAPRTALAFVAGLLIIVLGTTYGAFRWGHYWLPPGAAVAGMLSAYPLWTWRRLVAVSHYMGRQLEALNAEDDLLSRTRPKVVESDFVERQMTLLQSAIAHEHDLRRFLHDRISQMPDSVMVADPDGRILLANAGARSLLKRLHGPALLETADDILVSLFVPLPGGKAALDFSTVVRCESLPWSCEAETTHGDHFDVHFEPQRSSTDSIVGYVVRVVDITATKTLQRQREDMLQLLTHDMRAPQAAILALLDQATSAQVGRDYRERIGSYARRTLQLADDFVQLARAQHLEYAEEIVNLPDIAQNAYDACWPLARAAGITIETQLPDDDLLVMGEPSLLSRMTINLIDNAIKFSRQGGTVVLRLTALTDTASPGARITVSDNGMGISPEHMAKLFARFQRAPSGPAVGIGGVGLGLAFVHTVVVRHGGTIHCDSEEGKGTTFTIDLPVLTPVPDLPGHSGPG